MKKKYIQQNQKESSSARFAGKKILRYPTLVLRPFLLRPFCIKCPVPIYITSKFALSHFPFDVLWLDASCYADPLFLIGISYQINAFFYSRPLFQERNLGVKKRLGVQAAK